MASATCGIQSVSGVSPIMLIMRVSSTTPIIVRHGACVPPNDTRLPIAVLVRPDLSRRTR